ncbi:TetR family transcriptional regulator [Arthrobacter sp. MYb211]|uniref:TetR/AcrR family transcriptional regulator n=1 Tax=unclassified Arthrobacter TaxID=235627 RepID=UPI000CFC8955|nr:MULTISPECIES: TetR family transcriptional regulator [unclassified Arthrobacter]PRA00432.1 TetR family transcriptional regulator [Arthrobacter sp. MYb224]PRA04624.1 TetR family transcriptional regulator [Arthrobacter sp. MYb229]PRA10585.1 TetR family transcriptional regulator [Arthrobacter sp. MYb221]PRB51464.1 TetR family transcriptional regulator [Arthrobacter sp. MYb216]PRC06273.1 TetR family transcriptional regulator [Arthrobacter sp. MYb211]
MARISVEDRSRQFIEAAARVIASEGIAAATTRRIATEAGAPLAALHYCFRSKDDLLDEVYNHLSRDYARDLDPIPDSVGLDEAVDLHIHRVWRRMLNAPHEQVTTFELLLRTTRLADPEDIAASNKINRSMYEAWVQSTSAVFRKAATSSNTVLKADVETVSRMLIASIDGINLQHLSDPDLDRSALLIDQLCATIKFLLHSQTNSSDS